MPVLVVLLVGVYFCLGGYLWLVGGKEWRWGGGREEMGGGNAINWCRDGECTM